MRLALCGLLIAFSAVLLWQAILIGGQASVYPTFVCAGALVFSVVYTARQAMAGAIWPEQAPYAIPRPALARVAVFVAVWSLYVVALPTLGFIISTWLALVASSFAVMRRMNLLLPLWIAIFVGVLAVLLKLVLYVPVPQGWLDIQLEVFLYSLR